MDRNAPRVHGKEARMVVWVVTSGASLIAQGQLAIGFSGNV